MKQKYLSIFLFPCYCVKKFLDSQFSKIFILSLKQQNHLSDKHCKDVCMFKSLKQGVGKLGKWEGS